MHSKHWEAKKTKQKTPAATFSLVKQHCGNKIEKVIVNCWYKKSYKKGEKQRVFTQASSFSFSEDYNHLVSWTWVVKHHAAIVGYHKVSETSCCNSRLAHEQGRQLNTAFVCLLLKRCTQKHINRVWLDKAPDSKSVGFSGLPAGRALLPTREREELRFFSTGSKGNHHRQLRPRKECDLVLSKGSIQQY